LSRRRISREAIAGGAQRSLPASPGSPRLPSHLGARGNFPAFSLTTSRKLQSPCDPPLHRAHPGDDVPESCGTACREPSILNWPVYGRRLRVSGPPTAQKFDRDRADEVGTPPSSSSCKVTATARRLGRGPSVDLRPRLHALWSDARPSPDASELRVATRARRRLRLRRVVTGQQARAPSPQSCPSIGRRSKPRADTFVPVPTLRDRPTRMSLEMQERSPSVAEGSKATEKLSPEDRAHGKKGRGLLHVPSRSSSQRIQPSPTSTGLSGATASDPRDSIGGHSKESKGSLVGRRRNGSASSKQSAGGTNPTNSPGTSQPSSPAATSSQKKKKSGGLLSILGCCGVPDDANTLENGEDPIATKVTDLPARQNTSRRAATPSEQTSGSKTQLFEKEQQQQQQAQSTSESSKTKRISGSTAHQSTVGDRDTADVRQTAVGTNTAPIVTVDPPHQTAPNVPEVAQESTSQRDGDGDVEMRDAEAPPNQKAKQPVAPASEVLPTVPPPPPGPIPTGNTSNQHHHADAGVATEPVVEQKYLLGPVEPHLQGRKCLVLDLDETLVHSSFKVRPGSDACSAMPVNISIDTPPGRLHDPRGNRGQLPQRLCDKTPRRRPVHEAGRGAVRGCGLYGVRIQGMAPQPACR